MTPHHDDDRPTAPAGYPDNREPLGSEQAVSDPDDATTAADFVVMGAADPILASTGPGTQTPDDRGDEDVSTDPLDDEPVADPDLDPEAARDPDRR